VLNSCEIFEHENWTPETFNSQTMGHSNRPTGAGEVVIANRYSMKLMLSPEEVANQMMADFAATATGNESERNNGPDEGVSEENKEGEGEGDDDHE